MKAIMASNGAPKTGKAKLDDVTALLEKLTLDLKKKSLKTQQRDSLLEQLKVYGRSVDSSDPIFAKSGIQTLSQHAFDSSSTTTSREALRCLANALLLKPETRQILVDLGCAPKAAEKLKTDNSDDEFLLSRILFLMTYGTTANFQDLIAKNKLADSINTCLARHAKRYVKGARRLSSVSPMDDMALTETAKLVFNITHFTPDLTSSFSNCISSLLQIIQKTKIQRPPLQQPLQACINTLINLDLADTYSQTTLFPKSDPKSTAEQIIQILDASLSSYKESELDQLASPVITAIRKIYKQAPDPVKKSMETLLLPTDTDRAQPLGKSDALSSRLLRLSTSPISSTLRTSIQALLFELSHSDATKFISNVGYGYASGFLMSQNIPMPQNATDAFSSSGGNGGNVPINPITGQRLDAETHLDDGLPPMTDEEKEIEAEKLFVLFERLRATGVVDVVNPVRRAVEEGRFEELPDNYEEG